ncbi:hypothetical protein KKC13_01970 [bacterium]|nr:hypothetical protein [bacterium]MBU1957643.1 hypothetical protein [bacterium]
MFSQGGLSLEQAPPISVVLRFFITGAAFGVLLGVYLIGSSFSSVQAFGGNTFNLIVTHILALGVMASFMLGALFQMLPVIAGVVINVPTKKAMVVHLLLVVGVLFQLFAFSKNSSFFYLFSALFLGSGLLYATPVMLKEVMSINDHSSSSKGMLFALGSFVIAIGFGLYMLLTLGGYSSGSFFTEIKEAHYSFALMGWVGLLIASISFQVVEMFYVTPKYPEVISRYFTLTVFMLLLLKTMSLMAGVGTNIIDIILALLFIAYATITLHRLYKRKRPTSDATVWFWRLGMGLLIVGMTLTLLGNIIDFSHKLQLLSYITFIGFALSIVFAMVYKIVPFLVWFHLSNQGYMEAPMMHDVIHPKKAKIHFVMHIGMLLSWLPVAFLDILIIKVVASLLLLISFAWLLYHLLDAGGKYRYTQKYCERIEW